MAEDDLTLVSKLLSKVSVNKFENVSLQEFEIPKNLRPRGHVSDLLGLDAESSIKGETENLQLQII